MAQSSTSLPLADAIPDGTGLRFGIVAAQWHSEIVDVLLEGALHTLTSAGVANDDIVVVRCPGSFEIPVCAKVMATTQDVRAIIAIGVVVRGETAHFEYVSSPVAHGLMSISIETGIPCLFGVLTTEDVPQALARAGGIHGNKGAEAAHGALTMARVVKHLREQKP